MNIFNHATPSIQTVKKEQFLQVTIYTRIVAWLKTSRLSSRDLNSHINYYEKEFPKIFFKTIELTKQYNIESENTEASVCVTNEIIDYKSQRNPLRLL